MVNEVNAVGFRQDLGEILAQVQYRNAASSFTRMANRRLHWSTLNCSPHPKNAKSIRP